MAAVTLCYGRGKEVWIYYCPMFDLTSIVQLTVTLIASCPASQRGQWYHVF